jgi:hypothetical protein
MPTECTTALLTELEHGGDHQDGVNEPVQPVPASTIC